MEAHKQVWPELQSGLLRYPFPSPERLYRATEEPPAPRQTGEPVRSSSLITINQRQVVKCFRQLMWSWIIARRAVTEAKCLSLKQTLTSVSRAAALWSSCGTVSVSSGAWRSLVRPMTGRHRCWRDWSACPVLLTAPGVPTCLSYRWRGIVIQNQSKDGEERRLRWWRGGKKRGRLLEKLRGAYVLRPEKWRDKPVEMFLIRSGHRGGR